MSPREGSSKALAPPQTARGRYDLLAAASDQLVLLDARKPADLGSAIGYVHSFESAGTLDGPGIRFLVFLTGCPLRCLYCHNPDTWRLRSGVPMSVDAVMAEVDKYTNFLNRWGGGITFSGGEPLMQDRFLAQLLRRSKQRGLHTAIDTSGYLGERMSEQMLDDTDLVLLDIKAYDSQRHQRITGAPVEPTRAFAQRLSEAKKPIWMRFVLVPALTDDEEDIERLADFVARLSNVERVEVLPFHKMGEPKWEAMRMDYQLQNTPPPTPELLERVQSQFRKRGLLVF